MFCVSVPKISKKTKCDKIVKCQACQIFSTFQFRCVERKKIVCYDNLSHNQMIFQEFSFKKKLEFFYILTFFWFNVNENMYIINHVKTWNRNNG